MQISHCVWKKNRRKQSITVFSSKAHLMISSFSENFFASNLECSCISFKGNVWLQKYFQTIYSYTYVQDIFGKITKYFNMANYYILLLLRHMCLQLICKCKILCNLGIQVWNSKIDFNMEALCISCRNKHWLKYSSNSDYINRLSHNMPSHCGAGCSGL